MHQIMKIKFQSADLGEKFQNFIKIYKTTKSSTFIDSLKMFNDMFSNFNQYNNKYHEDIFEFMIWFFEGLMRLNEEIKMYITIFIN